MRTRFVLLRKSGASCTHMSFEFGSAPAHLESCVWICWQGLHHVHWSPQAQIKFYVAKCLLPSSLVALSLTTRASQSPDQKTFTTQKKSKRSKRGWREEVGDERAPKYSANWFPELCSPSRKGGIGKKAHRKEVWTSGTGRIFFCGKPPSPRQPLFETSEKAKLLILQKLRFLHT